MQRSRERWQGRSEQEALWIDADGNITIEYGTIVECNHTATVIKSLNQSRRSTALLPTPLL